MILIKYQAPSPGEVTVAEIDGRLPPDPNIEVYVRAEGVLFPQLQIPNNLKSPETLHQSRRVIVQNLPPRNVLSKTAQRTKDFIEAMISDFAGTLIDALPSCLSNSIFDANTTHHMQLLHDIKNQYPSKILAWHPYISLFAIAHNVDVIFLYDLRVEAWFPEVLETTLQKDITCMAWKPLGGNILATACWTADGRALFLSFYEDKCIRCLSISPNLDDEWFPKEDIAEKTIEQLSIDPTGERLAVCFKDTALLAIFHARRPTQVSRGSSLLNVQGIVRGPSWNDLSDPVWSVLLYLYSVCTTKLEWFTDIIDLKVWEDGQISFLPFLFRTIGK
ncbi:12348_t:CDS:2 [Racocetra fulgida]|uniref:12348_t:CDS:1 n=1 Tax=Racocetra fulgida TaxID=60492 RepID=A0A9N8ZB19_9GLOM|nr:12348_t:CDS:2 [Racocetra fulgida]